SCLWPPHTYFFVLPHQHTRAQVHLSATLHTYGRPAISYVSPSFVIVSVAPTHIFFRAPSSTHACPGTFKCHPSYIWTSRYLVRVSFVRDRVCGPHTHIFSCSLINTRVPRYI